MCNCCFLPILVSRGKCRNMAKLPRYLSTCNSDSHPVILHWTTWVMSWQYWDTLEPQLVPNGWILFMYDITFSLILWISQENAVCKHTVYFTLTYLLPRMLNSSTLLTFRRKMGWSCSIKCTSFLSKSKNAVPRQTFKLNGVLAAAEHLHLTCRTSKVKYVLSKQPYMHNLTKGTDATQLRADVTRLQSWSLQTKAQVQSYIQAKAIRCLLLKKCRINKIGNVCKTLTLMRIRVTNVAMEKRWTLRNLNVCL